MWPKREPVFICILPTAEEAVAIRDLPDDHPAKRYMKRVISKTCWDDERVR